MKKLFWVSALCLTFAGCASGGDVVGNGLTAGHPMNTMMEDSSDCGCGHCGDANAEGGTCSEKKNAAPGAEADCGCGHKEHHKKKKAK